MVLTMILKFEHFLSDFLGTFWLHFSGLTFCPQDIVKINDECKKVYLESLAFFISLCLAILHAEHIPRTVR